MSTFKYNGASSDFATAALSWLTCNPNAMLVDAGYVPSPAHQFVSDITAAAVITRDKILTSVAQVSGLCTGSIPVINALLWPNPVVAVIIYEKTGADSTSRLIYYSSDGVGFPFLAQGFNYAVAFDQSGGGWFQV